MGEGGRGNELAAGAGDIPVAFTGIQYYFGWDCQVDTCAEPMPPPPSTEAKHFPGKYLRPTTGCPEWLPGPTRAPCDKGLQEAVHFVIGNGIVAATPADQGSVGQGVAGGRTFRDRRRDNHHHPRLRSDRRPPVRALLQEMRGVYDGERRGEVRGQRERRGIGVGESG